MNLATLEPCSTKWMQLLNNNDLPALKMEIKELARGGVVDIEKCLNEGTQISVWNAHQGKPATAKFLILLISDMVNSFNVNRPMTPNQISDLAIDMTNDLWEYRFEELAAFFEAVKRGSYIKIYERLDASIIWEAWDKYLDERFEVIVARRNRDIFKDPTLTRLDGEEKRAGKLEQIGQGLLGIKDMREKPKSE